MTKNETSEAIHHLDELCPHRRRTDSQRSLFGQKVQGFELRQVLAVIGEVAATSKAHEAFREVIKRLRASVPLKTFAETKPREQPVGPLKSLREWARHHVVNATDFYQTTSPYQRGIAERWSRGRGDNIAVSSILPVSPVGRVAEKQHAEQIEKRRSEINRTGRTIVDEWSDLES